MFCENCKNQIPDGATFCSVCGMQFQSAPQQTAPPVAQAPVTEDSFAQVSFDSETQPVAKKKKGKKALLISCIAIILVVAIVVGIVIIGKGKKSDDNESVTVGGPNGTSLSLLRTLSMHGNAKDKTRALAGAYNNLMTQGNSSLDTQISFNVSDDIISTLELLLKTSGADGLELDWLKGTNISLSTSTDNGKTKLMAALYSNGEKLLDADLIMDFQNKMLYFGVPTLSPTYLTAPIETISPKEKDDSVLPSHSSFDEIYFGEVPYGYNATPDKGETPDWTGLISEIIYDPAFKNILPTGEEFHQFLDRYTDIITTNLTFDSSTSVNLTVGNVTQTVTEYTMEITESEMMNLCLNALTAIKSDPMIVGFINDLFAYLNNIQPLDIENPADTFAQKIDEAIEELKEEKIEDKVLMTYTRYVDNNNFIVGRRLTSEGETGLYQAVVQNSGYYASTFEFAEVFKLSGQGTIVNNAKTGTYTISAPGDKQFTYSIKDFTIDNGINGSVIINFPSDAVNGLADNPMFSSVLSGMNVGIELVFNTSQQSSGLSVNLVSGDKVLFGINFAGTPGTPLAITIPDQTMSAEDSEAWAETIIPQKLMELIQKSPFKEIFSLLTTVQASEQEAILA